MAARESTVEVVTRFGAAHILLDPADFTPAGARPARGVVVLGHGASGGPGAADIVAVAASLGAAGCVVLRSVQPYRVAGRRLPAPVAQLDEAFGALVAEARRLVPGVPLVVGGRSNGARVAARTATALDASAVLALSFPLHPPSRPERSRADELAAAGAPAFVLQGEKDSFGTPAEVAHAVPGAVVHPVAGAGHSPKAGPALDDAARAAADWVLGILSGHRRD
jgi:predicted alpha/beta-hydrolase family hydrolase